MRRFLALTMLLAATSVLLPAGDFEWLVREFSRESGAQQLHIPFFGLVRFAVGVTHPAGTSELKLAVFENTDLEAPRFSHLTDAVAGSDWKPMVRVRSRHESTNIYARQSGKQLRLLIATLDDHDATFVQVRIKPEELMKFVDEHGCRR